MTYYRNNPEIKPFPKNFRRARHNGESIYTSSISKFQILGNELGSLKRYMDVAPFFGKGTVRRSAYNDKLLKYAVTGAS
jgi:hypothetical protein